MRGLWMGWVVAVGIALVQTPAFGQSLLEQLEKKVRDGLELTAPKDASNTDQPAASSATDASKAAATNDPLPAPKKSAPPSTGGRTSASILEPPDSVPGSANQEAVDTTDANSKTYLGLEAESVTGGGIGARIVGVTENSPAWRAGFKVNDVILAIDGFAIANLDSMVERLAPHRPGDPIKALVLRSGRNVELTAVLQSAAVAERIQNGGVALPQGAPASGPAWIGLSVADMSTAFRNQFGLRVYRAAAVTEITDGSPAALAGIRVGDALVAVDGRKLESARDFLDWLGRRRAGDRVSLTAMRGTLTTTYDVTLAADPKVAPAPPRKPVVSNGPAPAEPSDDLTLGDFANTAVGRAIVENTVPPPPSPPLLSSQPGGSQPSELEQLREELRAVREQMNTLEQRIMELEKRLDQPQ